MHKTITQFFNINNYITNENHDHSYRIVTNYKQIQTCNTCYCVTENRSIPITMEDNIMTIIMSQYCYYYNLSRECLKSLYADKPNYTHSYSDKKLLQKRKF